VRSKIRYVLRLLFISWWFSPFILLVGIPIFWLMEADHDIAIAKQVAIDLWRYSGLRE
jgi:hypothetical protein